MIPLRRAQQIADKVSQKLAPFCERIETAGSVRRERDECHDIDLILLPRDRAAIESAVQERCTITKSGPGLITAFMPDQTQLDLWFARGEIESDDLFDKKVMPPNFGSVLLCRTGSTNHNIGLVAHAHRQGLRWHPHDGVMQPDDTVIASETEEAIFEALGAKFIAPTAREHFAFQPAAIPPRFEQ